MTKAYLQYALHDGFVHNWLVLGPRVAPLDGGCTPSALLGTTADPVIEAEAVEPAAADDGKVAFDGFEGNWRYYRCAEDHFVDLSGSTRNNHSHTAWAYVELEVAEDCAIDCTLTMVGPPARSVADVWINRVHVHHVQSGSEDPAGYTQLGWPQTRFHVGLTQGRNVVLVRFEATATASCAYAIALQVVGTTPTVCLPTHIERLERRALLEDVFYAAYADRYVVTRADQFTLSWPSEDDLAYSSGGPVSLAARLRTRSGKIYAETKTKGAPGKQVRLGPAYRQQGGLFDVILMPQPEEYYQGGMHISRAVPLWSLGNTRYFDAPSGTLTERRSAALVHAARLEANVYSEIAKMAVGWWSRLDLSHMQKTLDVLRCQCEVDHLELLGYLGLAIRFGEAPEFPESVRSALAETVMKRGIAAEVDSTDAGVLARTGSLATAACEILAGQLYPEQTWPGTDRTGQAHRRRGEELALTWMRECATRGLRAWHSDTAFEEVLVVLAHLIDFADSDEVWQTATVLLDKLLFQLAVNSFKGVLGSSRGSTSAPHLFGGYLAPTSGISYLLWGAGILNHHIRAIVSLACLEDYQLPVLLQAIATDLPPEGVWSRERHPGTDIGADVSTVTYKTPDGMLSAALDYHPGERGVDEHIWQATLGAGATVFVTHPVCSSLDEARRPNYWRGNGVLPRVAQWRDALIALYALPDDDWMGYTHAYFPVHAFDDYVIHEGWAFARKGDGYLALTASQGLTFVRGGDGAYRELRSHGCRNVWLCQMGRAALDTDFATFQDRVLSLPVVIDDLAVRWTTVRGETLSFDWSGPLIRNDEPLCLTVEPMVENPYCVAPSPAETMEIRYGDVAMRLNFVHKA